MKIYSIPQVEKMEIGGKLCDVFGGNSDMTSGGEMGAPLRTNPNW